MSKTPNSSEKMAQNTGNLGDLEFPERIPVYLPDEEVKKFMIFQEFFEPISILVQNHVFEQKNATILLDFDKDGVIRSVRRQDFLYTSRM